MKVYIAGQITGLPKEVCEEKFQFAESRLTRLGFEAINPLKIVSGSSWEECMKEDIKVLVDCDAILLLDNYSISKGALLEHQIAVSLGLVIMHERNDLVEFIRRP
jgi:hypothetical protein